MSEQKHTPAPWSVGEQNGHCGISINGPEGGRLATVYLGLVTTRVEWGQAHFDLPENAESVANAAIIVRAVNSHEQLVAALRDCVAVMERDLIGLAVIQPELAAARDALTAAGAA